MCMNEICFNTITITIVPCRCVLCAHLRSFFNFCLIKRASSLRPVCDSFLTVVVAPSLSLCLDLKPIILWPSLTHSLRQSLLFPFEALFLWCYLGFCLCVFVLVCLLSGERNAGLWQWQTDQRFGVHTWRNIDGKIPASCHRHGHHGEEVSPGIFRALSRTHGANRSTLAKRPSDREAAGGREVNMWHRVAHYWPSCTQMCQCQGGNKVQRFWMGSDRFLMFFLSGWFVILALLYKRIPTMQPISGQFQMKKTRSHNERQIGVVLT